MSRRSEGGRRHRGPRVESEKDGKHGRDPEESSRPNSEQGGWDVGEVKERSGRGPTLHPVSLYGSGMMVPQNPELPRRKYR